MIDKAIILAAGVGSRLRPITNTKPKCLVEVNGIPILGHMISNLISTGIDHVTIVCGYKRDILKEYCHKEFSGIKFTFIDNNDYSTTNNLYSLFLAKEQFVKGSYVMNADIIFDKTILSEMQKSDSSCVAVDVGRFIDESMKVVVEDGFITAINKKMNEQTAFGCSIDLYKFNAADAVKIIAKADQLLNDDGLNEWTEVALDKLFSDGELKVVPFDIEGRKWFEIDNLDDLAEAEILFNQKIHKIKDKKVFFVDNDGTLSIGGVFTEEARNFIKNFPNDKELFILTNNSSKTEEDVVDTLKKNNIETEKINILISTLPTSLYLKKNKIKKLFWAANKNVSNWLLSQGFVYEEDDPDAVLLCYDTSITYDKLSKLTQLVRDDVPYYATHVDMLCPVKGGYLPDIGSFIEMIHMTTKRKPIKTFGKPDADFILPILEELSFEPEDAVVIGDRLYTDVALGKNADIDTVLVLSGEMTRAEYELANVRADIVIKDVGVISEYLY